MLKNWIKAFIIIGSGFAFWVLTGNGGAALLGIILIMLLEFRYATK